MVKISILSCSLAALLLCKLSLVIPSSFPFAHAFTTSTPLLLPVFSTVGVSNKYRPLTAESNDDNNLEEEEWISDMERAKQSRQKNLKRAETSVNNLVENSPMNNGEVTSISKEKEEGKSKIYTEEEEELIQSLGGDSIGSSSSRREPGYLGDSSLEEIASDFQIPICYLADILCGWGVSPPIDTKGQLGDMVTGEQAFALLEVIYTLDMGALNDRYSNMNLLNLCNEYDVNLKEGFQLAISEGWNLPFGVRTFLRVEQEDHLIKELADDAW